MGSRDNTEYAMALDARDGSHLWEAEVGAVAKEGPPSYPGPRSTPTVDGDRVYVLGSDGDLVCLTKEGQPVWHKNLEKDLGGKRGRWAYSESVLVDGDVVVCTPGGPEVSLAALNKKTGETVWKCKVPEGGEAAYASAIAVDAAGVRQYVQLLAKGLAGVAAKDGKFLWHYAKLTTGTNCPTPIFHDGCVFESDAGPGGGGCALLRLVADGPKVAAQEVYNNHNLMNHHGGIVRVGESVYGTTQTDLVCVDFKTGEVKWKNRCVGKGSIAAADGRLYVRSEQSGRVALVEATPEGYKEKGRLEQPDRSKFNAWPHPVIANGRLYLRDDDKLFCYDVKGSGVQN
jgi:outer membrane protein assembly factor BamB